MRTGIFTFLARLATTRPRLILAGAVLCTVLCGAFGATVTAGLKAGGFYPPDAESARADAELNEHFGGAQPNLIVLITADGGVDSPAARSAGEAVATTLRQRGDVRGVQSYWTVPPMLQSGFVNRDRTRAMVVGVAVGDDNDVQRIATDLQDSLPRGPAGTTIQLGGYAAGISDVNHQVSRDLLISEAIALPISGIVLVLVFGSLIAALLPLAVGMFAIVVTLAVLRALTLITDVSVYALNMTTALGLAVAIDYSLFMVSRFREELAAGHDVPAAVTRTVQTAGRTVLFSAVTVALSLAALAVFPMYFLKSFAYAGVAVVAAALIASLLVLPACLVLLGHRVNSLDLRRNLASALRLPERFRRTPGGDIPRRFARYGPPTDPERSGWYRMAALVMRRPIPIAGAVIALLLLLGSPFLGVRFGYPDDRVLESATDSRAVGDALRSEFDLNAASGATAVLPDWHGGTDELADYARRLSTVPGVSAVLSGSGIFVRGQQAGPAVPGLTTPAGAMLRIPSPTDPFSEAGQRQTRELRTTPSPGEALFTGPAAQNVDVLDSLGAKLPLAAALIAIAMFVLLFLFTGSVVLPIKALVLNTLSLSAAFGAMVWVFQDGHLSGLLGFTATGYLVANMPILMFCLAFGLSMDYEVFLLSRIREEWLASGDNAHAVAVGVTRTGPIVTAAAVLMAIVLGGLTFSRVSFMQLFGLGLAVTVLVDATLIRCLLMPATMRLLGRFNWWSPAPLRRLHDRVGLTEKPAS